MNARLRDPERFLVEYRDAFGSIHGAFTFDAALLFFVYGGLLADTGLEGATCEIGVHHGLSAIAVAALRGEGEPFYGIDTFGGARDVGASGGMSGDERIFRANMERFFDDTSLLRVIAADSRTISPSRVEGCTFFHIDGGHSAEETRHDLELAATAAVPGGLVALDDYFNPSFPGVSEGTVHFLAAHPRVLIPLAIGHNKVIFQRAALAGDLNARLVQRYPFIPRARAVMGGADVLTFGAEIVPHIAVERSSLEQLVSRNVALRAELHPHTRSLEAGPSAAVPLTVTVRNRSDVAFSWSDMPFGLSYHVLRPDGSMERYENARSWFIPPLPAGAEREITLQVLAPDHSGEYEIRVDVVWDGVCWLADRGSDVARVPLRVR